MMSLGKKIKERRKTLQIKQLDLAGMVGMSVVTLSRIENEKGNPRLDTLKKLLDVLGLEIHLQVKDLANENS